MTIMVNIECEIVMMVKAPHGFTFFYRIHLLLLPDTAFFGHAVLPTNATTEL